MFDEISVFEAGKSITERVLQGSELLQRVYIFVAVDSWKSNVKKRKSVLTLLVKMERVRVFSLEVTMESLFIVTKNYKYGTRPKKWRGKGWSPLS